mgnify:CR=1 FL=1
MQRFLFTFHKVIVQYLAQKKIFVDILFVILLKAAKVTKVK